VYTLPVAVEVALTIKDSSVDRVVVAQVAVEAVEMTIPLVSLEQQTPVGVEAVVVMPQSAAQVAKVS
jgi:hypothetical protein